MGEGCIRGNWHAQARWAVRVAGLVVTCSLVACSSATSGDRTPTQVSGAGGPASTGGSSVTGDSSTAPTEGSTGTIALPPLPGDVATLTAEQVSAALDDPDTTVRTNAAVSAFRLAGVPLFAQTGPDVVGIPWMYVYVHANPPGNTAMYLDTVTHMWAGFSASDPAAVDRAMLQAIQRPAADDFTAQLVAADQLRFTGVPVSDVASVGEVHIHPLTALLVASSIYYGSLAAAQAELGSDTGASGATSTTGAGPGRGVHPADLDTDCMTGALSGWVQYSISKIMTGVTVTKKVNLPGVTNIITQGVLDAVNRAKAGARMTRVEATLGAMGAILNVLSYLWQWNSLNANVDAPELNRTRSTKGPGYVVAANVSVQFGNKDGSGSDAGKTKAMNCVQMVLSAVGVNSSVGYGPAANLDGKVVGVQGFAAAPAGWVQFQDGGDEVYVPLDENGAGVMRVEGQPQQHPVPEFAPKVSRPYKVDVQVTFDPADASSFGKGVIDSLACLATFETVIGCTDVVIDSLKQFHHSAGIFELKATDYQIGWRHALSSQASAYMTFTGAACSLIEPWTAEAAPLEGGDLKYTFVFTPAPDGRSGTVAIKWANSEIAWAGTTTYTVRDQTASYGPLGSMMLQLAPTKLSARASGVPDIPVAFPGAYLLKADPTACG